MKRNPSKSWRHRKEFLVPRQSNFAKFSGITTEEEATSEREDELREDHPHLFATTRISRARFILRGLDL
jgi:hypothetical protein